MNSSKDHDNAAQLQHLLKKDDDVGFKTWMRAQKLSKHSSKQARALVSEWINLAIEQSAHRCLKEVLLNKTQYQAHVLKKSIGWRQNLGQYNVNPVSPQEGFWSWVDKAFQHKNAHFFKFFLAQIKQEFNETTQAYVFDQFIEGFSFEMISWWLKEDFPLFWKDSKTELNSWMSFFYEGDIRHIECFLKGAQRYLKDKEMSSDFYLWSDLLKYDRADVLDLMFKYQFHPPLIADVEEFYSFIFDTIQYDSSKCLKVVLKQAILVDEFTQSFKNLDEDGFCDFVINNILNPEDITQPMWNRIDVNQLKNEKGQNALHVLIKNQFAPNKNEIKLIKKHIKSSMWFERDAQQKTAIDVFYENHWFDNQNKQFWHQQLAQAEKVNLNQNLSTSQSSLKQKPRI